MPHYVIERCTELLNRQRRSLNGSRVLVLGVAYKRDITDLRESPAIDILQLLRKGGAEAAYHDPHVPQMEIDGWKLASVPLNADTLGSADLVVLETDHRAVDYRAVVKHSRLLFDTRNATRPLGPGANVHYL
jgi:UDP-N-acetyl-D-glucosamine dehydrogenase